MSKSDIAKLSEILEIVKEIRDYQKAFSVLKTQKEKTSSGPNVRQFAINSYEENPLFFTDVIKVLTKAEEEDLLQDPNLVIKLTKKRDEKGKRKTIAEFIYSKKVQGQNDIVAQIRALKNKALEKEEVKKPDQELVEDVSDEEDD